jgi:thiol-disulfide isomerase/thioredoxin
MKKIILLLCFILTLGAQAQIQNYNLNDVVSDFTVTDIDGEEHNLYDITSQGKYVYLDFFFVDCPPCQQTTPIFNEFYDKYGCNEGEVFCISINTGQDNDAQVAAFESTYGGTFNHAPAVSGDGGSAVVDSDFNPAAYPTYCLINPNNEIIELDIWAGGTITIPLLESTFPAGFDPEPSSCGVLSVDDAVLNDAFKMVPNPSANGTVDLTIGVSFDFAEVKIYNMLGAEVFAQEVTSNEYRMETNLSTGVYLVNLSTDKAQITKKLVIK